MIKPEPRARAGRELRRRYTADDLRVLTPEEARRFVPDGSGDPQADPVLAWELLYRLEPELYDELATAERLHPGILAWLPHAADTIVEVGSGAGRLTLELLGHGGEVVAIEPAMPLRRILEGKIAEADPAGSARVMPGFFDDLPLPTDFADLVVTCSALTPAPGHGGDVGLSEMERVCRPGGCIAIVWPNNIDWLAGRGYQYVSFAGPMSIQFASYNDAVALAEIFYPSAVEVIRRRGERCVPFEVVGINPPRDVAFKVLDR